MIFSYLAPGQALRDVVRSYLVAHFRFGSDASAPVKPYAPKPEQGITFFPRGGPSIMHPLTGAMQTAPPASIFGQQTTRCDVRVPAEFLMFRVHFQPGALFRTVHVPLHEFAGGYFDAELVFGREARHVSERLAHARSYAEMITVVEEYLSRCIAAGMRDVHPVDRAAAFLTARNVRFSLRWLADQAGVSPRQFNRTFTERIGVGPKLYSRIVRFRRAYRFKQANPPVDWLTAAVRFGYTDYQHMVREFRQFTNVTPPRWIHEDRLSPEAILKL